MMLSILEDKVSSGKSLAACEITEFIEKQMKETTIMENFKFIFYPNNAG